MQAIILAAGMGKRLGNLTKDNTKCMVKVNGIPLIDRVLGQLSHFPLSKVILVIGYKGEKLKEYLEKYWYVGHKNMGWYDIHKAKEKLYYGYWSFEAGAIAKILNLDDSNLKNVPYYPYDLVHYKK